MARKKTKKPKKPTVKFTRKMSGKLVILFSGILVALVGLGGRLMYIEYVSGDRYTKIVLSQQSYDSVTIPYQRGDIVDSKGTVLATSVAVYNVILDCSVMTSNETYIDPTIEALVQCFPEFANEETLRGYAADRKDSKYIVLAKKLSYDQIQEFVNLQESTTNSKIRGVWFEKEYQREYPYNSLASSLIGFTSAGNVGTVGLENYYNSTLNGINGREYGYLNTDNDFEKTVIDAEDGDTLVTTIDANIQSIVESKILEFNEAYANNAREGAGSTDTAVIVMDPNTGEILAMANYPNFDLNNPRDLTAYYSQEQIDAMSDEDSMNTLNALWQNFCVTHTYEPGSVQKPFTVAGGLETGTITTDMEFLCDGGEDFAGSGWINCVKRNGHGVETVEKALMDSCNDAIMQMSYRIGPENFLRYQSIFGFGLRTGIDLPGEANTSTLVFSLDNIKGVDLATNAFGQNYNCTMIQMVSAFSSLVNGGTYYQPHVVKKITDADGNTISTIEPTVLKETVSQSTSDTLREYMYNVVTGGTAQLAKVDGYSMGGKTGTAQTLPRGNGKYLVSFMGYAPQENPQVVIYCVVNEPNVEEQSHSTYALNITREILEEVLPYMNIYPDEETTGINAGLGVTGNDVLGVEPAPEDTTVPSDPQ